METSSVGIFGKSRGIWRVDGEHTAAASAGVAILAERRYRFEPGIGPGPGLGMRRGRSLAWEVRPPPPPPYFFQNVVIPLSLPFRVGKRCDSKGVKYKGGKLGFGYGELGRADGIRRSEGAGKSGCQRPNEVIS